MAGRNRRFDDCLKSTHGQFIPTRNYCVHNCNRKECKWYRGG